MRQGTRFRTVSRQRGWLFLGLALGTAVMAVDDAFMVHERIELDLVLLGTYALTVAAACVGVIYPRVNLAFSEFLALAILFLGGSLLIDNVMPQTNKIIFVEDAFKFIGICLWSGYLIARGAITLSAPARSQLNSRYSP